MTVPAVVMGLQAFGAVVGAVGALAQGAAAQSAAEFNADMAEQDRRRAVATAQIAEEDARRDNVRRLSTMRANLGASGLELSGSPLEVLADTTNEMALDERRIMDEGRVRSRDLKIKSEGYRMEGRAARTASYFQAGSSLIGGATSMGETYLRTR
jgi:hypothetical protein